MIDYLWEYVCDGMQEKIEATIGKPKNGVVTDTEKKYTHVQSMKMNDLPEIVRILRQEEVMKTFQNSICAASTPSVQQLQKPTSERESEPSTCMKKQQNTTCKEHIDFGGIEEKYQILFGNYAIAITLVDDQERIVSWNHYTEELLNMDEKDLFLKPIQELYPPEEWKKIRNENIRKKGIKYQMDTKIFKKNQEILDVELSLCMLRGAEGKIVGSAGIIKDISKLKKTENKLKDSEDKFKLLYNKAPTPYHTITPQGIITDVNEKWCKTLGYLKKEIEGKSIFDFIDNQEQKSARQSFQKKLKAKKIYTGGHERTYITKKGGHRIFVSHDFLQLDTNKEPISMHTIMNDITERKSSEEKLKQSEEKYRTIFDLSPQTILLLDKKGIVIDSNERIHEWLGYKSNEIIGKKLEQLPFLSKDSKQKSIKNFAIRMKGKKISPYELEFKTKDLGKRIGMVYGNPVYNKNKQIIGDLIVISDITERQLVWEDIVKSEERYRILAETSADGVFTTDALGRLTYVNPSFEKMCGRRKSKILGTLFRDYLLDDSVYYFQQIFIDTRKKHGKLENIELELVSEEGSVIPIEVNIATLKKKGIFEGIECTARDITERRKVEDELKKNERLKTEFMNIAAHELKSPVTPIKGYLDLIICDKEANDKIKEWAKISLRNAERLLKLVNDILDVSRLDSDTMRFDMGKIDTIDLLSEIAEDMKASIVSKGLEFPVGIPKNLPNIIGDKHRLSQVLKNIIGNAIKFTDNGFISLRAKQNEGHIQIIMEDTGVGISKGELKKIFTKFYQAYTGADRRNEGTGLGLFISKEIIEKHNGKIWAESMVGKGSSFIIQIPYVHKIKMDI